MRIFSGSNIKTIENNVNRFIQDKHVIAIKQSESMNGQAQWNLTLTVLYEDFYQYNYLSAQFKGK